jgi:predicted membrane chloride channel (bestrophin family)
VILFPWVAVVAFSIFYTIMVYTKVIDPDVYDGAIYALVLVRISLSFLLVFRLGRAAARYWEGRQLAGTMINKCRILASISKSCLSPEYFDAISRLLSAYPIATKNYLRKEGDPKELKKLLPEEDANSLLATKCQPIWVLDSIREVAQIWADKATKNETKSAYNVAVNLSFLMHNID